MLPIVISPLGTFDDVEIVEREGFGHPDTICDVLSEPALISVQLATPDLLPLDQSRGLVEDLVADHLNRISELIRQMVAGNVDVF